MSEIDKPTEEAGTAEALELDTEGHSLFPAEFAGAVARDRQREVAQNARDEARRRELRKPGRSLRDRLFGR